MQNTALPLMQLERVFSLETWFVMQAFSVKNCLAPNPSWCHHSGFYLRLDKTSSKTNRDIIQMCLYSVGPEIQGITPLLDNSTPQDLYPMPTLGEGLYPVYS